MYENEFIYFLSYFFLQQPKFREIKIQKQQVVGGSSPINYTYFFSYSSFSDEKEENFESYGENEDVEYEP